MPGIRDEERALQRALDARLGREQTIWLATTRSDGLPHLVPVWFVWYDKKVYICTSAGSQKMVNMKRNSQVAVALPDTTDVLVIEGQVAFPLGETVDVLAREFGDKYGWNFLEETESDWRLVEIAPAKVLAWNMQG